MFSIIEKKCKTLPLIKQLAAKFLQTDECQFYTDLSFYYYLARQFPCEHLLEIGFGIGAYSGSYLFAYPHVNKFVTIQEPLPKYSSRIGISNIRKVYKRPFTVLIDDFFALTEQIQDKWQVILLNEADDNLFLKLQFLFEHLNGIICVNYALTKNAKVYREFCKNKNIYSYLFKSKNGIGIILSGEGR